MIVVCLVVDVVGMIMLVIVCIDVNVVDLFILDSDLYDVDFVTGECIFEGFYCVCVGID